VKRVLPRVLMVGRTRYRLPLDESLARKFDALRAQLDLRVLATGSGGDETFVLEPLGGLRYHLGLPLRVARELRRRPADALLVQNPHEAALCLPGRRLARSGARIVVDVHGDWRTATRLYGSRARRLLDPVADRVAELGLRRADAIRTVSPFTTRLVQELGLEPAATFAAFMDLESFLRPPEPLPERPTALFVGVLERYKNVDGLAEAWRQAAPRVPEARLRLVGDGSLAAVAETLVRELPEQTAWAQRLEAPDVARALDEATVLVLPSRSEGMGRVVVEAFCRGRGVVGTRVGGIADLVEDGISGLLVEPGDVRQLADALVRALSDRALAQELGRGAAVAARRLVATPEEYAERLRELVERVLAR
jgi:glycosyltransferase involved in cell wall biosynthesis